MSITGPDRIASADTWPPLIADGFRAEHIEALLEQRYSYILVPGFLSAEWCAEIVNRFLAFMREHPDRRIPLRGNAIETVVRAMNLFMGPDSRKGPAQLDEYFALVPRDRPLLREIYRGGRDPYEAIAECWRDAGWKVLPAIEGTRPFHTDVLWGATGHALATPHVDSYHQEYQSSLSRYSRRFSHNTFIQAPLTGGQFRVYRHRRENGPFSESTKLALPHATYDVHAGDLLVFDAGHFHEVIPMDGERHRLFSHLAVGLDPPSRECSIFV